MNTRPTMPTTAVLLVALAITLNYIDRGNLATAASVLQDELQLSNAAIGVLLSSFFWAYAPAQLLR
jgi:sugar phosphate permease